MSLIVQESADTILSHYFWQLVHGCAITHGEPSMLYEAIFNYYLTFKINGNYSMRERSTWH